MRACLFGLLIGASLACSPAAANSPAEGNAHDKNGVLRSVAAQPVSTLGADALRFSTEPQLGGTAIVVEATRRADGSHRVRVRRFEGHPRIGWAAEREWSFRLSDREYRALTLRIDQLLALPDPQPDCDRVVFEECGYVCTDGAGILVERATDGRALWRRGSCGPRHPNDLIEKVIRRLVRGKLGRDIYPSS